MRNVPMRELPVHPEPDGISDHDVPADYVQAKPEMWGPRFEGSYTLRHLSPRELVGHDCSAECWAGDADPEHGHSRDMEDDYPGEGYERSYVERMARDVASLPALVGTRRADGGIDWFGGQHRIAAHGTAGTLVPIWVRDEEETDA